MAMLTPYYASLRNVNRHIDTRQIIHWWFQHSKRLTKTRLKFSRRKIRMACETKKVHDYSPQNFTAALAVLI